MPDPDPVATRTPVVPDHDPAAYWRDKAAGLETAAADADKVRGATRDAHTAELARLTAEHAGKLTEITAAGTQRLIRAELKALAIKAGITDPSDLALLDVSKVTLDAKGDVADADAVIEAFRKLKPHLFGPASSSSNAKVPGAGDGKPKQAKEMTDAEYTAARALLVRQP